MEYPTTPKSTFFKITGFISFSVAVKKARRMLIMRRALLFLILFSPILMISKPEENIMKKLFKNSLDCHISFIDTP